jgi:hypothetical protein
MKKEFDLSKMKSRTNPYAAELLNQERALILEGIARGEVAVSENKTFTQLQDKKKLARWLKK